MKKNNNKLLIIIVVILLNLVVFYMVGMSIGEGTTQAEKVKTEARAYLEQGLCVKAIQKFDEAVVLEDSEALRLEIISAYAQALESGELEEAYSVFNNLILIIDEYPENASIYKAVCEILVEHERYEQCAELLMQARSQKIDFKEGLSDEKEYEKMMEIQEKVKYQYRKYYAMYTEVMPLFNDMYTVATVPNSYGDEDVETPPVYSFLNNEASGEIDGGYTYASSFSEGYAFVKSVGDEGKELAYIIDKEGVRQAYFDGVETSSGVGGAKDEKDNTILLLSCKVGETYKYYDINGKEVFGDYAFAGRFRNNIAAVKDSNGKWSLIDGTGKSISDKTFDDVILNEFDECAPKGMIIAKENGKYHIYDINVKQVGDFSCDDAKAFVTNEQYAAFKSGDAWGFVDATGKVVIKPQYEDAKSFSNDMGAVKIEGKWTFISKENKIVVNETFEDVGYLSSTGICFVKSEGHWCYLKMFYTVE